MPFKLNISEKGKAWKLELESEALIGKKIGEKIEGEELRSDLKGFELEITGTSDKAGFPGFKAIESQGLKRVLLTKGKGMWTKPKGLKKKPVRRVKGLRLKKTIRGNTISKDIIQINMKVLKQGSKKLEEIFPEQNKPKEKPATVQPTEQVQVPVQ